MEKIDWNKFNDNFVRLENNVEKKLKLRNWVGGEYFGRPGISFDVEIEDGQRVEKQFTVTSRRLILKLKPILLQAEEMGKDTISISVTKSGEGVHTKYAVSELPQNFRALFK